MSFAVRMRGITKRFGSVTALDRVDLDVEQGIIHAIVGENGAGKTTLMRVLYGALNSDEGSLEVEGKPVKFGTSREAIQAGVGMVSQHYGIIPELTCLQNLILGAEGGPILRNRAAEERANALATKMGFEFDWQADASSLSPAGAQKLEILKLLWREARVMILDEPTAMLSPADAGALFESLDSLARDGATILLVTHRLPEVLEHCRTVTVLRAGKRIDEKAVAGTNGSELAQLIVGGALEASTHTAPFRPGAPVLEVSNLSVKGDRGEMALKGVGFQLRSGEILGIAGVDGSGQRELFESIAGLTKTVEGSIVLEGKSVDALSPSDRIAGGMRLIPEDRHAQGVVEEWSLNENAALGLQRLSPFARGATIDGSARHEMASKIAERFDTKHGGLNLPMSSLSGGNQQRFVAARSLCLDPRLVLAFQPARGLDIKGTLSVYEGIREVCRNGAAALVVSFDLDELLEQCDRVVAMNHGRMHEPPADRSKDRDTIGRLMVGAE
ncbi:MAG: ABC transporter ATP-binding protein [Fimbriimonas sp.]|nr:ABC transporter ATP-binding protein [Fimbriimonas sp.]